MRVSQGAFALLLRLNEECGVPRYLTQWNRRWNAFNFVGGHKRERETFRECVVREVAEELELTEGAGYWVAQEPLLCAEYVSWSDGADGYRLQTSCLRR